MTASERINAIPKELALRLCREIREEQRGKWYSWTAWWCRGCETASKGDPAKMCFSNHPEYRGCLQVNRRYDDRNL
jgi:hypothetical protein